MNYKRLANKRKVSDSSWNRLLRHMQHPFFICSPFRASLSAPENRARWNSFTKDLKSAGLGYIVMNGSWIESDDEGNPVRAFEFSAFVPEPSGYSGSLKEVAFRLAEKFNQEGVILKESEDAPIQEYLFEEGSWVVAKSFKKTLLSENAFNDFYSKIYSGRDSNLAFKFVDTFRAQGFISAMNAFDKGVLL